MVPLDEAKALALDSIAVAPPAQVPLSQALGRFLAEPVRAPRSLPNFDNSAMDGYALHASDTAGANRDLPARLQIIDTIYAGGCSKRSIGLGQAARIFTGAPMPVGADCVVRQEAARGEGDHVLIFVEAHTNANVRRRGEELADGDLALRAGQRLDAYALGVLASVGVARAAVWTRPRAAILTLGDELVPPGREAQTHQVYDSNAVLLTALAVEAGAEVTACRHAADREDAVREALEQLVPSADLLITSGGASVGDKDLAKRVLRSLGASIVFDGVAMKPGKSASVGVIGGHPVAILPGNPGAAAVAFDQIARPMLIKRQGVVETRPRTRARLGSAQHKQGGLTYLLSAKLEPNEGTIPTASIRPQGSGQLLQNIGVDGWVVLPPGRADFTEGDEATMELFAGATFRPALSANEGPAPAHGLRVSR
jgi:molybdopterin molybdotransferase